MSTATLQPVAGVAPVRVAARYGMKGSDAAHWLARSGVPVPDAPNRIARWDEGRCLRLGHGEFLVELERAGSQAPAAADPARDGAAQAWVLLRSDHSLLLSGAPWPGELARICSFDFDLLREQPDLVVMTLLAGIGVTLVREPAAEETHLALRLWCDASHASYLHECLQHLAAPTPSGGHR